MRFLIALGVLLLAMPVMAKEPTFENVLLTKWKMSDVVDYESQVDDYMKTFRASVWERYENDEFELADKRQETVDMMKQKVDAVDLSDPFVINTSASFGEYDFDRSQYDFSPLSRSTYFPISRKYHFRPIRLTIENPEVVDGIPMEKDRAKAFLTSRKNQYGNIDRRVQLSLTLEPIAAGSDSLTTKIVKYVVEGENGKTLLSRDLQAD